MSLHGKHAGKGRGTLLLGEKEKRRRIGPRDRKVSSRELTDWISPTTAVGGGIYFIVLQACSSFLVKSEKTRKELD